MIKLISSSPYRIPKNLVLYHMRNVLCPCMAHFSMCPLNLSSLDQENLHATCIYINVFPTPSFKYVD